MAFVLVDVIFFVVLLLLGMSWLTIRTSALDSCYLFHTTEKNLKDSDKYCQQNGGNIVSMETEEEYQYINKTIQSLNVSNNEWYIGLNTTIPGNKSYWHWISGHNLTIDKWRKGQPSGDGDCAKMIKDYVGLGLLDDVKCTLPYMFICEYKKVTSQLKAQIENDNHVINHTCYDINNNAGKKTNTSSVAGPSSNSEETTITTKGKRTSSVSTTSNTEETTITTKGIRTSSVSTTSNTEETTITTKGIRTSSVSTTSNTEETTITTKEIRTTRDNMMKGTTSISTNTSSISTTSKTTAIRKEQPFPIMIVVIVLAVLLAVCMCMFVAVFCWLRNKSGQRSETKSSRNPSEKNTAAKSLGQDQSNLGSANSDLEGLQILSGDAVIYAVLEDDIDYPGTSAHRINKNLYDMDSYAEVHDAIPPSAKSTAYYNDDENPYLIPVESAPTLDADAYANVEPNSKPYKGMASQHEESHRQEETIAGRQQHKKYATEPATCNSLYATSDLTSKPSKALAKSSKQALEQQYKKDATNETASFNNLYATTDLSSKTYQDETDRTQLSKEATSATSFYNNLYESTDLIMYLQDKAPNEGLEQDGTVGMKENKLESRDCQIEASDNGIKKSRHPSIGTIMSGSRKSQGKPSIPTHYKQPKEEPAMYAMVDLLNNDKGVNVVYDQVDKK